MTPTVKIRLDKRKMITTGEHTGKFHAKIFVTFIVIKNGVKYWDEQPYKTGLFCTPKEYAALMENDPKKRTRLEALKQIRSKLDAAKARAELIIETFKITSQKRFDQHYLSDHKPESIGAMYQVKINELLAFKPEPKISSAEKYQTSLNSLMAFFGKNVSFHEITADRLQDYEQWYVDQSSKSKKRSPYSLPPLSAIDTTDHVPVSSVLKVISRTTLYRNIRSKNIDVLKIGSRTYTRMSQLRSVFGDVGVIPVDPEDRIQNVYAKHAREARKSAAPTENRSITSVGINLRHYRHILNRAIKLGLVPVQLYPFGDGDGQYTIPEGGDDTKQFLEVDELPEFLSWKHENDAYMELYDYAVFSYYAAGMNFADIARIRKSNMQTDYIKIDRSKSKNRKKKRKPLITPIHPKMMEIIRRRGNKTIGVDDPFIFPILNDQMTPTEKFKKVRRLIDDTNNVLSLIAEEQGLSIKLTTYTLRHSFANKIMDMGGSTEELQDLLGHGQAKTTEAYKHGFSLAKKQKMISGL